MDKIIITVSSTIIATGIVWIVKALWSLRRDQKTAHERQREHEKLQDGALREILRRNFFEDGLRAIEAGEIDPDTLDIISASYQRYHALGGNHAGTAVWEQVKRLPLKPSKHFIVANSLKEDK